MEAGSRELAWLTKTKLSERGQRTSRLVRNRFKRGAIARRAGSAVSIAYRAAAKKKRRENGVRGLGKYRATPLPGFEAAPLAVS